MILSCSEEEGSIRGEDRSMGHLLSYVKIEERIAPNHSLRHIRALLPAQVDLLADEDMIATQAKVE